MVLQIDAKRNGSGRWEALCDAGREHTGLDAVEWAVRGERLGAGEILLTSVDREGTRQGFDVDLVREISNAVGIPVIASGGMGRIEHLIQVAKDGNADAIAMAYVLHYRNLSLKAIREAAQEAALNVRHH